MLMKLCVTEVEIYSGEKIQAKVSTPDGCSAEVILCQPLHDAGSWAELSASIAKAIETLALGEG